MEALPIELLGSPVLREKAEEVATIDDEVRKLVTDMFTTMYMAEGIGLAANQVGVARRILVVDLKDEETPPFALINPRILEWGSEWEKAEEGCLSIPGVSALVERPARVVVEGLDTAGNLLTIEGEGLLSRCLQHEIDHLDGVLFIDHLSALKRSMLLKKYRSLAAEDEGAKSEGGKRKSAAGRNG